MVESLARDVGLSRRSLYEIVQFYKAYPIVVTVSAQLSWSHYTALMKIKDKQKRKFYESSSIQNSWSIRELRKRIRNKEYGKARKYKKGGVIKLSPKATQLTPKDVFKSSYNFNFLDLERDYKERDLKAALLNKVEEFIKELGYDFFIGRREVPVLIGGNYDKIDLELFHARLMCYVIVEIKTEHFKHSHVSQMYSYLNWYKEHKWIKGQRCPIGLIICKTKEEETVHYALGDLRKDIFVAEYKTKLPSEQEIESKLKS